MPSTLTSPTPGEPAYRTLTPSLPCDTPLYPVSELKASNGGMFADLDFSTLSPEYASKSGIYAPDRVQERARQVRRWLRDREEDEIVGEFNCPDLRNHHTLVLDTSERFSSTIRDAA